MNSDRAVESHPYFQALGDQFPQPVWMSRDGGDWIWANSSWTANTGLMSHESHGDGWKLAIYQDDRQRTELAWARADLTGTLEVEHRLVDIAHPSELRWFHTFATPLPAVVGQARVWLGRCTEMCDRTVSQDSVQRRVDRLLALIRTVVRRTNHRSSLGQIYAERIEVRLSAIGRTQSMLNRPEGHIDIAVLVREALLAQAAHEGKRISIEGPRVIFHRAAVDIFGLALQELATNAAEHGALSKTNGSISVGWHVRNSMLCFEWNETLGTELERTPVQIGFGKEVIETILKLELGAVGSLDIQPSGVKCTIVIPLGSDLTMPDPKP